MAQKYGKVYLVGSGPGDPELLTLKARRLLDTAEVVVYDQLPGKAIIDSISVNSEKIDAGKHAGEHTLTQDEINALIVQKAKEGKDVVRLKGGDPYMFGRGGEEAQELIAEGIGFEVVPGITSAVAVPAARQSDRPLPGRRSRRRDDPPGAAGQAPSRAEHAGGESKGRGAKQNQGDDDKYNKLNFTHPVSLQ